MRNKQQLMNEAYRSSYGKSERLIENWQDRINVVNSVNDKPLSHDQQLVLAQCLDQSGPIVSDSYSNPCELLEYLI